MDLDQGFFRLIGLLGSVFRLVVYWICYTKKRSIRFAENRSCCDCFVITIRQHRKTTRLLLELTKILLPFFTSSLRGIGRVYNLPQEFNNIQKQKLAMNKNAKTANEVLTALEYYYDKQDTATKECLLALKAIILSIDKNIVHTRKYQIPFFTYHAFNLGFLWIHRKKVLIGFVEDGKLLPLSVSGRKKDKVITIEIDPAKDIPLDVIRKNILALLKKYDNYL